MGEYYDEHDEDYCSVFCEWCGDCLDCYAGDPCPFGGVH